MRFLAIDLGYSNVKVAYYNESGILQFDKYISAVAKVDQPMEADDDVMFRLGPNYYIIGPAALKTSRSNIIKLETFEDLKNVYPVWVSYLLKKYGGMEKFDKVVIGLSMAFSEKAEELLTYLCDSLMIRDDSYFMCLPQGLSCKLAYYEKGLDIKDPKNEPKLKNFIIVDGGFLTVDCCAVISSKSSSGSATGIANTGVIRIVYNIVDYIFKEYELKISVKEGQKILDQGGIFNRRGVKYDISEQVKKFTKEYLNSVLDLLEKNYSEQLDVVDGVLILGGLAYFFQKYISENDSDVIKMISKHFPVDFIHYPLYDSEFFNAYSYLIAAEKVTANAANENSK